MTENLSDLPTMHCKHRKSYIVIVKCISRVSERGALPVSDGEGGSLSSRSSAEDMVPVDGVLGSLLLKSPKAGQKSAAMSFMTAMQGRFLAL